MTSEASTSERIRRTNGTNGTNAPNGANAVEGADGFDTEQDTTDDEVVTWWGLVIEGYLATQDRLMGEIAERFDLAPASFDILLRLIRSPQRRMPMTRLAGEAALSSGGFTKVADRLVAADLICRVPSPHDRRVTYAALTEHGTDVALRARAACAQILRRIVLEPLGTDSAAALADAMRTLRSANGT